MLVQTARTLKASGHLPKGTVPIPNGFMHNGWGAFLPPTAIVFLVEVMNYAYEGLDAEGTIKAIEDYHYPLAKKKNDQLFFNFSQGVDDIRGKKKRELFLEELESETERKKVLEQSGYYYPQTIRECIELGEKLGMIQRFKKEGTDYYDVTINPFPHIKHYLKGDEVERWRSAFNESEDAIH
ncbi:DUF6042 family protein [Halalkalibacter krulwichiae]|uniref:Uncharacterized protein n=1 Tax=Halalkalibacter krulwichiae TaxID=199441 RepID=A0A1X9MEI4_9BACI|nr:DUF6042 family protein [Halalkalibacter krulwichiae]ARK31855.1 hypothetical protein BkAM31D_19560 [Halalkalibacter krulwichiae]